LAEEFIIKSADIEDKINQLLPSQGGFQAGVDFSASTMVIPIVDLTETAEGSQLRQDLQSSLSLTSVTSFSVTATTTTIVNTTGYYRVFGCGTQITNGSADRDVSFAITDGTTTKNVYSCRSKAGVSNNSLSENFDFIVKLEAGDSLTTTASADSYSRGCTRQIADLSGNLVNP